MTEAQEEEKYRNEGNHTSFFDDIPKLINKNKKIKRLMIVDCILAIATICLAIFLKTMVI